MLSGLAPVAKLDVLTDASAQGAISSECLRLRMFLKNIKQPISEARQENESLCCGFPIQNRSVGIGQASVVNRPQQAPFKALNS